MLFVIEELIRLGTADDDPLALPIPVEVVVAVAFGVMCGGLCALVGTGAWVVTTSWPTWTRYLLVAAAVAGSVIFIAWFFGELHVEAVGLAGCAAVSAVALAPTITSRKQRAAPPPPTT